MSYSRVRSFLYSIVHTADGHCFGSYAQRTGKEEVVMIYGENAAVRQTDDCHCDWTGQCPRCGHIESGWTRNHYISAGYRTTSSLGHRTCSKCHTQYEVKLVNMR